MGNDPTAEYGTACTLQNPELLLLEAHNKETKRSSEGPINRVERGREYPLLYGTDPWCRLTGLTLIAQAKGGAGDRFRHVRKGERKTRGRSGLYLTREVVLPSMNV